MTLGSASILSMPSSATVYSLSRNFIEKFDETGSVEAHKETYTGATRYVGGSGPGNFSTIQTAIDASADGDIVYVYPGIYYETIWINKTILLCGENQNTTIIDAPGSNHTVSIDAIAVTLRHFTIQHGNYYGILLDNVHGTTIESNTVQFNGEAAIYGISAMHSTIANNTVHSNKYGIHLDHYSRKCTMINNHITNNSIRGLFIQSSSDTLVDSCHISMNNIGVSFHYTANITITNCLITENIDYGIRLKDSSNCTISFNILSNNGEGITLFDHCLSNTIVGNTIRAFPNSGPIACNDTASTYMEHPVDIDVAHNDVDRDGTINGASVLIQQGPLHGLVSLNGSSGIVTYTPFGGYNGTDSFTYTIQDNNGIPSNIAKVHLLIIPDDLGEELSQQQLVCNRSLRIYSEFMMAQTFRMTGTLTKLYVYMNKVGTPLGDVVLTVFENNMSGSPITSCVQPATAFHTAFAWILFDVSDIDITPSSYYIIVVNTTGGDTNNCYQWGHSTSDEYYAGIMLVSADSGSTWAEVNTSDFCFMSYKITGVGPVAAPDTYDAIQAQTLVIPAPGVLNNDHDPDEDPQGFLTALLDTDVSHGDLDFFTDGSFFYTPSYDFIGVDTFTYHASDGDYSSSSVTVSLNVTALERYCLRIEYPLSPSHLNIIDHNNFYSSTCHPFVFDENTNIWDNTTSYAFGGNFWSNYNEPSEGAFDIDTNGIVDAPYDIAGGDNSDRYPLLYEWEFSAPIANFSWVPLSPIRYEEVEFTDFSIDQNYGFLVSWSWDFGDGTTASEQHPHHKYVNIGKYNVTLTVMDDDNVSASMTQQLTVIQSPPVAFFTYAPLNPTIYSIIQFTDASYDFDGTIANWTWDFGDGVTSYLQHPTHQYASEITFIVCLTVADNNGSTDSYCINLTVVPVGTIDVNQSVSDRGFPIRSALDGTWGGAQNFTTALSTITRAEIYLRKFGDPVFNLSVELREGSIDGFLLDTLVFAPDDISTSWEWLVLDCIDVAMTPGEDYFIVCSPPSSDINISYGYEWGYAFGDQYSGGSFWFTRDGGIIWRDLPTMYEFTIRIFGQY